MIDAYLADGQPNLRALSRIQDLMRDLHVGVAGPLPLALVHSLSLLQERLGYDRPLRITSGYRTQRTNASIEGSAPASLHLSGFAADITSTAATPLQVALAAWEVADSVGYGGLGLYDRHVHMDVGPRRAWTRVAR